MADTIVSQTDVFRTKAVSTGWNIYRSTEEITSGTPVGSIKGGALIGKFIRDVQTSKGYYSLMQLAIPLVVTIKSGLFSSQNVTLTQVYIQNQALEKAVLKPYVIAKGSTTTGACNRRTGPGLNYALITPPLKEGESAGSSEGTVENGYMALWDSAGKLQFVSKSYLAASVGGSQDVKVTTGTETILNNVETAVSGIDWKLLLKSIGIAALALGLGAGIAYLVERLRHGRKRTAL